MIQSGGSLVLLISSMTTTTTATTTKLLTTTLPSTYYRSKICSFNDDSKVVLQSDKAVLQGHEFWMFVVKECQSTLHFLKLHSDCQ